MNRSTTLPSLLWSVLDGLDQAYVLEGAGRLGFPSLDLWSNLLRIIDETSIVCSEVPAVLRLSKRAVRTRTLTAVRHGLIEELKLARGRAKVRLTARGTAVATRWKELEKTAEQAWCERVGSDRAERLRAILKRVVAALPLEHPHYPARYGPADARITGENGIDWKAVPRNSGVTLSELSFSALTSQALVAFAMEYEKRSPVALSVSLSVIKRIPSEGTPIATLGHGVDLSGLRRHGFVRVGSDHGKELAYLTSKGLGVSLRHDNRIHAVQLEWSNRYGTELIAELRSALEDVVPDTSLS